MRDSSEPRASNSGNGPNPYAGWIWRVRNSTDTGSSASSSSSSGGRNSAASSTASGGTPWGDPRYERRVYAVLVGPYLYEYGSEDDANAEPMAPRAALEVIGVSASPGPAASALAWSRPTSTRFLLVSRCGTIYQAAAASEQGKLIWVAAATAGLNAVLDVATGTGAAAQAAAAAVAGAAASAPVPLPPHSAAAACLESGEAFSLTQPRYNCMSCGGAFVSELVTRDAPLPHHGAECGLRTCDSCRAAQECAFAIQLTSAVLLVYRRNLAAAAATMPPDLVAMGSEGPITSGNQVGEQPGFSTGSALGPLGAPSPLLQEALAAGAGNNDTSLPKSTRRHLGFWLRCGSESARSGSSSKSAASPAAIQAASAAAMSLRAHAFQLAHARDFVGLSRMLYVHRGPFASMSNTGRNTGSSGSSSSSSSTSSSGLLSTPGTGASIATGRWASSEAAGVGSLGSVKGSLSVFASILDAFLETVELGWPSQSHGLREAAIDFVLPQILQIYFLVLGPHPSSSANSNISPTAGKSASSDPKSDLSTSVPHAASQRSSNSPEVETSSSNGEFVEEGEEHYGYAGGRMLTSTVETAIRLELLRGFILKLCSQSLSIAVKVVWSLLGHLEDAHMTPDLGPTGPLEDRRLRSKKAGLALLMLEVEATIAEAGRPLGCCFGEARGLFPRLLKPTPGQMAVLVGQAAVLESSRLRLGCSNFSNESATSRMLHPPAPPAPVSGADNPGPSPQRWRRRRAASNNSDRDSDTDECSPISSPRTLASTLANTIDVPCSISVQEPLSKCMASERDVAGETLKIDTEASTEPSAELLSPPVGADAFYKQLTFTARLTDLAERMRFIEPKARAERLRTELAVLNRDPASLGYFPMGGPLCPVIRIPAAEGYVFKTKARAPTLVLFEILRHNTPLPPAEEGAGRPLKLDTTAAEVAADVSSLTAVESPESSATTIPEREVDWALGPFEQDSSDDSAVADAVESLVSRVVDSAAVATETGEVRLDDIKEGTVAQSPTAAVRVLEVESLIGDQIERRLTRSASLQEHNFDGDDDLSVKDDDAASLNCEIGSGTSSSKNDTSSVSSTCADDVQVSLPVSTMPGLPNQDEVRGFVRSHSGKLPLSQLALLGEEEDEDAKLASNVVLERRSGGSGSRSKVKESEALASQQLDLEYAAAAAAAATASSIVRGLDSRGSGRPNSPAAVGVAAKTAVAKAAEGMDSRGAESSAEADTATSVAATAAANATRRGKRAAASEAVLCARELYANGQISAEELETLIAKDTEFQVQIEESLAEDERFLLSAAFGESWAQKKKRIQAESPEGQRPGWDLVGMIVKSNDDLRQEVCALQLIELSRQLFEHAELPLFLRSYTIISTDASTGLIEILTDVISIDALKKRQIQYLQEATDQSAYVPSGVGLAHHFEATYGPADSLRGCEARRRFASSLAAYSAVSYAFAIKDRHNGNILLDTEGHLIHIDFGFLLGIAPGGAFSIETAPFKLTDETVQVLGGVSSKLFADFVLLFSCAFLVLQAGVDQIAGVVDIMCDESPFPCFAGVAKADVLAKLKQRLRPDLDRRASVGFAIDLIRQSMSSTLTRQYDNFQWLTNGIMP